MTPRNHLVIFAKAPRIGTVKTRLAHGVEGIGRLEAWRFYWGQTQRLLRNVGHDPRWRTVLAVTPDRAAAKGFWPGGMQRVPQGHGGLGARMARVFDRLPPGPAVIVGSDIPGVRRDHIAQAFRALAHHDAVFGPAADGGYWLVGLSRRRAAPGVFRNVRWSTRHALADTLVNLRGRRVAMLEQLSDVDTPSDYDAWKKSGA
jgi:rSAM/selenodomain-associated transferase 1